MALLLLAYALRHQGLVGDFGLGWQRLAAFYAIQARNLIEHGLLATGGAGVVTAQECAPEPWSWYLHHPPGHVWAMALSFLGFGATAFAAKLPGVLGALLEVELMRRLVTRAVTPFAGGVAAFVVAAVPAGSFFSTHGSELGPLAVSLALLALEIDARARERDPQRPPTAGTVAAASAAALCSWAPLLVVAAIAARDLARRDLRRARAIAAVALLPFALHAAHAWWVTECAGGELFGGSLITALWNRTLAGETSSELVDFGLVARRLAAHSQWNFTLPGLALATTGVLALAWPRWRSRIDARRSLPLLVPLLALGIGYVAPFPQGAALHRYWLLVALPAIALLAALGAEALRSSRAGRAALGVALAALLAESTERTLFTQSREATRAYAIAGRLIQESTPPAARLLSCEPYQDALVFHSRRELLAGVSNELVPEPGQPFEEPSTAGPICFVLFEPPLERPALPMDRVAPFLHSRYFVLAERTVDEKARRLTLYDLTRRPDGRPVAAAPPWSDG